MGVGRGAAATDVLLVSLGSTAGLAAADEDLAASLRRAGAIVELARAKRPPRELRTMMLTDLAWARSARAAARQALAQGPPVGAVIYSTTTAALFGPVPGAIRFDASAVGNRPGRHGLWQRPLERRRLREAPLLLPLSEGGLHEAGLDATERGRALVVPLPVEPSGPAPAERDIAAIAYAGNPAKKGLDRVLEAWRQALRGRYAEGGELLVAGASPAELDAAGIELSREPGVRDLGRISREEYRSLVRRSRVFVIAPRREDYGQAQLEALADGCLLATTPAPGPYAALPIARRLDSELVDDDLGRALMHALRHPDPAGYASRAREELAPLREAAVDALVAQKLLPLLMGGAPPTAGASSASSATLPA